MISIRKLALGTTLLLAAVVSVTLSSAPALAGKKPNILEIWGDDIGQDNISAYHCGLMGGTTPNIDRIAKEMTDACAQASCTAGRAAFILGQNPFRTGLLTIGMSGAKHRVRDIDPTIAELLKRDKTNIQLALDLSRAFKPDVG